jgi:hypothetical protein
VPTGIVGLLDEGQTIWLFGYSAKSSRSSTFGAITDANLARSIG